MARVTSRQLDGLFGRVTDAAQAVGLDVSAWSFGHHFGANLTLVVNKDRPEAVLGTWASNSDAETGMQGMLAAFDLVAKQRG